MQAGFRKVREERETLKENYFVVFEKDPPPQLVFPIISPAGFGVVDDDRSQAASHDGPEQLLEFLVVGVVGGGFDRLPVAENRQPLSQLRLAQFRLIAVEQRSGRRSASI